MIPVRSIEFFVLIDGSENHRASMMLGVLVL